MILKRSLVSVLSLQMILLPVAFSADSAPNAQNFVQVATSAQFKSDVDTALNQDQVTLVDQNGKAISYSQLDGSKGVNFAVVSPSDQNGQRIAFQFIRQTMNSNKVSVRLVLHDFNANPTLLASKAVDSTSITLKAGEDARQLGVRTQRAMAYLQASLSAKYASFSKARPGILARMANAIVPSAQADAQQVARWLTKVGGWAFVIGACTIAGGFIAIGATAIGLRKIPVLGALIAVVSVVGIWGGSIIVTPGAIAWIVGKLLGLAAAPAVASAK